jgi:hypothetical protein
VQKRVPAKAGCESFSVVAAAMIVAVATVPVIVRRAVVIVASGRSLATKDHCWLSPICISGEEQEIPSGVFRMKCVARFAIRIRIAKKWSSAFANRFQMPDSVSEFPDFDICFDEACGRIEIDRFPSGPSVWNQPEEANLIRSNYSGSLNSIQSCHVSRMISAARELILSMRC